MSAIAQSVYPDKSDGRLQGLPIEMLNKLTKDQKIPDVDIDTLVRCFVPLIELNNDKCNLCLDCLKACLKKAICFIDGEIHISKEKCNNCGKCITVCATGAIFSDSIIK